MSLDSDEQVIAIVNFNGAIKREVMKIKRRLEQCEDVSEFRIDIEIGGRVHSGDIKINYKLGSTYGGGTSVEGNNLQTLAEEFLRRHRWQKENKPLQLTVDDQQKSDGDNITF